jgi:hypothetical protein
MKRPDFEDILKIGKCFFTGVKGPLHTTGVQIPIQIFRLPQEATVGALLSFHVKMASAQEFL